MASISPPPPTYDATTLSKLVNIPTPGEQRIIPPSSSPRSRRQTAPARPSGWNRQSVLLFADFNRFESPRGSRRLDRESDHDEELESPSGDRPQSASSSLSSTASFSLEKTLPEPPHHVFSLAKKKRLIWIVSLAAMFSPLSSNIYFPALGQVSKDLNINLSVVSLTITVYMVVQGIAPSFWGPLSDTRGRRVTFIGTFVVYLISNIGLAFSNNFASLMIFRGIQAAGSAATISVGAGVIGDITTAKERGGLMGVFGGLFGGIISQYLGFRAIFWFLFGFGALTLSLILLLLPETLRSIAGNGTIRLTGIHRPLIYSFSRPADELIDRDPTPPKKVTFSSFIDPFRFLFEKDVFITLFFGAIVYTEWSMVTSSTTALFEARFGLNQLQTGLAFLPNGAGAVAGSIITGNIMNYDYNVIEDRYRKEKGIAPDAVLNKKTLDDFPIEEARLRNTWWMIIIFVVTIGLYGFSLSLKSIAVPLVLQFLISFTANAVFNINSALVVDLFPGASASATAINNLARCSLGAAGVAVVQLIIDSIGAGPTFAMLAGIAAVTSPLLLLEWFYGEGWRMARKERLRAKEEREKALDGEKN